MIANKKLVLLIALLVALVPTMVLAQAQSVTLNLIARNNSGQDGTATVTTGADGKTTVVLNLKVGPAGPGVPQPAHIHTGSCPDVGGVKYPLTNVVDGKSTTTGIDVTLATLTKDAYAINVHKSAPEVSVYTSCANVTAPTAALPRTGNDSANTPVLALIAAALGVLGLAFMLRRTAKRTSA